jgi:hypothetical protein
MKRFPPSGVNPEHARDLTPHRVAATNTLLRFI